MREFAVRFALDLHPRRANNSAWLVQRTRICCRFVFGRLPHALSTAPPGGPPFLAPFFAALKEKTLGCVYFQIQEMHHGKEVVLWQS